mmetsp:Transcript_21013/g.38389  ORF Transcript_21013/g.38389 Transcript_21013/m.38389 type:complete len:360 (+) Transcript_21013:75-1154(+)
MSQDVDLLQGVYALCCGNRPSSRKSVPSPSFPPPRRFTWNEHYRSDTGVNSKDESSSSKDCSASAAAAEAKVEAEADTEETSVCETSELRHGGNVEAPDLSQPQDPPCEPVLDHEAEQSSGTREATSCSVRISALLGAPLASVKDDEEAADEAVEAQPVNGKQEASNYSLISSSIFGGSFANLRHHLAEDAPPAVEDQFDQEAEREQLIEEIMRAAQKLEGPVQKYPKSGRGLLKSPQERYIVALPILDRSKPSGSFSSMNSKGSMPERYIGDLSYWEDEDDYLASRPPKGVVPLAHIRHVNCCKDDNHAVRVQHKCDKKGGDMCDMILLLPSKSCAEDWCRSLSEFLPKLRQLHGMKK